MIRILWPIACAAFVLGMGVLAYQDETERLQVCAQLHGELVDGICIYPDGTYYL